MYLTAAGREGCARCVAPVIELVLEKKVGDVLHEKTE